MPSRRRGATSSSGCSRPTGAPRRRPWPRDCRSYHSGGSPTAAPTSRTWTSPPSCGASPSSCLVDELAHTNAPGLEHEKRYEDIEDLLDAGIDVLSTVNVQHLESLNDQVAELSGARVRETVPDSVLGRADEVVLIDLSPEALLTRLRAGKVYKPERVDAALNGFFRIENLAALREVALRQVAEEVEAKRLVTEVVGTREGTSPPTCRRPSASACSRWSSPTRARSGSSAVRGARLSASAPSSTCSGSRRPAASRTPSRSASSPRCASSPPCSARR